MKRAVWVVSALIAGSLSAADRSWTASGDGHWSETANWSGGLLPGAADTALFSNAFADGAVVSMDGTEPVVATVRVSNPDNVAVRVFEGAQAMVSSEIVKGRTELRGEWRSDSKDIMGVGAAASETGWLTLAAGGLLSATNRAGLYLGNANDAKGRVTVQDGARLLLSEADTDYGISVGRNSGSAGSVVQEGGSVSSVGRFMPGYYGHGAYELLGGVLDLPYGTGNTRYRMAVQASSTGLLYQRGGELYVATNGVNSTYHFEIGSGNNHATAIFYADGGTAHFGSQVKLLSGAGSNSNPSYGELTVDGAGVVHVDDTVYLRSNTATFGNGVSAVNLNRGGTLRVPYVTRGSTAGVSNLNGDGGILEMSNSGELVNLFSTLGYAMLYEGGMELGHAPGSGGTRITGELRGPDGFGVVAVTVSGGGSGYLAPPLVALTGGSGSNATAVAFIDHDGGAVTGVVVTCRGEGYGVGDAVTVGFSGGGGSGASASALLAENRTGPLVKRGAARLVMYTQPTYDGAYVVREGLLLQSTSSDGAPNLSAVRVSGLGATFQNGSGTASGNTPDKWDLINPAATLGLGGAWGGGECLLPCGADGTSFQQHYGAWDWGFGRSKLTTAVDSALNGATLTLSNGVRRPGAALTVTTTTNLVVALAGDTSKVAFGSVRPVVPGAAIGVTTELTTLEGGCLAALSEYDAGFGADSNVWLMASAPAGGDVVNSLRMEDTVELTLEAGGTTVIGSGMVMARAGSAGGTRIAGGALTSGNGADLVLTDFHNAIERRNVSNGKTGLVVDARVTDNGATPVGLFALGRTWDPGSMSIAVGPAVALTSPTNTYSGGTYIIDTALAIADDGSLGAVPSVPTNDIWTSGMAMLRAPAENVTVSLHSNRNIRVCDGGLTFFGDDNTQAGRVLFDVAGDISGAGVLVMNHWTGGGVRSVVRLSGDNRDFEGDLAVHGILRLADEKSLPTKVNIDLCGRGDVNSGGGILELAGTFAYAPGSGLGQVRWGEVNDVAPGYASNNSGAYGGGFSACDGVLTVNLGGDRRLLTMGQDGFSPARLRLQSDYATDDLTWENPVDVTNQTLIVQVAYLVSSKTAVWCGAVTSSADTDGGGFTKTGNGTLVLADGADFGSVAFTANNTVKLQVTNYQDLACDMSGSGLLLEKYGAGVTRLAGSNTYANATRIYEGALLVNGTNTGGGTFTVSAGATLGGSGTVSPKAGATVSVDGFLAPGADLGLCGTLAVGSAEQPSALTLNGTLALDLTADACDRVDVAGNVELTEAAAITVTAADEALWSVRRGDEIPVLTWTGTLSGNALPASVVLPQGWKARISVADKTAYLSYASPGTMLYLQ